MENDIPKIHSYHGYNECKEHTNIYIDRDLPCPYPNCKEGIKSDKFIDKGFPINNSGKIEYHHEETYIRKSWNDLKGNTTYKWINENQPLTYIHNIIYDEIYKNFKDKRYETIYHYTTIDTLYKILESNELWLTEWRCTNDSSEIKHGLQLVNEFNKDQLELERVVNKNNYFITSFSYEINKVTLFDRYANKAEGVAIEFDTNSYDNARKSFWYKNLEFVKLMPVIYDEETQKKILQYAFYIYEISKQWLCESKDFYTSANKLISKKKRGKLIKKYFLTTLEEIISFFKHPSFEDERETRWLFRYDKKFIKKHKLHTIEMKNFNEKNYFTSSDVHNMSYEKAYGFQKLENKIKLPIKSIILGSRVQNKEQVVTEIKKQCLKFCFEDVEIKISDLPYK